MIGSAGQIEGGDVFDAAQLSGVLRDLFGLLALPALCHGRSRREVAEVLVAGVSALVSCRIAYLRFGAGNETIEVSRPALEEAQLARIRDLLTAQVLASLEPVTLEIAPPDGAPETFLVVPIGFYGDAGLFGLALQERVASRRDRVILRAATLLASTTLETAHLLERVQEADRRKDEFLAVLGHELRNPLAPVLSSLQLMKLRDPGADQARDIIERQTRHMMRLIDDLLDISRIARGKIALSRRDIAATDVIVRAVELASPLIDQGGHQLSVSIKRGVYVHGDPVRLVQLFSNLLTNAARYTDPGGQISVTGTVTEGRLHVAVRDTGRGIAPEMLERIFEPFTQVDRNKDALHGGLGLGLALVRTLVELHEGSVTARSEGLGRGSEFVVDLPVVAGPAGANPQPAAVVSGHAEMPRRVLVVDDNTDAAKAIVLLLSARGHQAAQASSGNEALDLAKKMVPDVAILDTGLPDMSGGELAARLRDRYGALITLISLSGFNERPKGFDHYLVKPAEFPAVLKLIEHPM